MELWKEYGIGIVVVLWVVGYILLEGYRRIKMKRIKKSSGKLGNSDLVDGLIPDKLPVCNGGKSVEVSGYGGGSGGGAGSSRSFVTTNTTNTANTIGATVQTPTQSFAELAGDSATGVGADSVAEALTGISADTVAETVGEIAVATVEVIGELAVETVAGIAEGIVDGVIKG